MSTGVDILMVMLSPAKGGLEQSLLDYGEALRPEVVALYRDNHARQTVAAVRAKREAFLGLDHARMGVFDAMDELARLVDASDPDTELSQRDHALQTACSISPETKSLMSESSTMLY